MNILSDCLSQLTEHLRGDSSVKGLLITGSVAYGYSSPHSDMNIMIIVSDQEFEDRFQSGSLHYDGAECKVGRSLQNIDGKYISMAYLEKVARCGSEPARFAFLGAIVVFSDIPELRDVLNTITEYPMSLKQNNIHRFYAQFEAWYGECKQALKRDDSYLLHQAVMNMALFGGRMVLAHNEMLYPGHKWMMRVLDSVREKPERLREQIQSLMSEPREATIEQFYRHITEFRNWGIGEMKWADYVIRDSELHWLQGSLSVAEL